VHINSTHLFRHEKIHAYLTFKEMVFGGILNTFLRPIYLKLFLPKRYRWPHVPFSAPAHQVVLRSIIVKRLRYALSKVVLYYISAILDKMAAVPNSQDFMGHRQASTLPTWMICIAHHNLQIVHVLENTTTA